jgi:hypothetical protein
MRLMFIIVWWSERKVILEEREKVKGKAVLVTLFSSPLFFFLDNSIVTTYGEGSGNATEIQGSWIFPYFMCLF